MSDLINKYPYTDFHAVNLDYILKLVRENSGLHLEESGNQILLKTADNTIVSAITAPYAASAGSANTASSASYAASAGSSASATYATSAGTAATATNATNATKAASADYATSAGSATSAENATYATSAGTAATATNATHAASADFATTTGNVEHADNAFEKFELNGNYLKFTTYDGTVTELAAPYAVKASRDSSANFINQTYVANVVDNNGTLEFKNAQGNTIVSLIPSVTQAVTDSYGNTIADYVKSVSVESGSNYVTIDHGTGTAETLQIPYSDTAWKDTNGNVIKNTYVKRLEIITDPNDGHKKLVAYNGDNPEAELFRIPVEAYRAQEAAEADHAAAADYATSAGTAGTADTCKNTNIYIKTYRNNDGNYDPSDPSTLTIESITNSAGDSLSLSDIVIDNLTNVILIYHEAAADPYLRYYPITKFGQPTDTSPVTLQFSSMNVAYDADLQKNTLDSFYASLVIRNGSLLASEAYISTDTFN